VFHGHQRQRLPRGEDDVVDALQVIEELADQAGIGEVRCHAAGTGRQFGERPVDAIRAAGDDGDLGAVAGDRPRVLLILPGGNGNRQAWRTLSGVQLDKITIIVDDYDLAIAFFTDALGFDLAEDSPSLTNDGRPKRWVVVRPPGGGTGILLAQADGERQAAAVGNQIGGRVGFFLTVDDFDAAYQRMTAAGVEFATVPRTEPYGQAAVFVDIAGNRWDLLGPAPA